MPCVVCAVARDRSDSRNIQPASIQPQSHFITKKSLVTIGIITLAARGLDSCRNFAN